MVAIKHRTYRTLANAKTWDGSLLSGGESIRLINAVGVYDYVNVQDSRTALEPFTFVPDSNPGTNSWHLVCASTRIGALVGLSSNEVTVSGVEKIIPWDSADYDDANFWEGVTNPERLSVPIGVTKVKVALGHIWTSGIANTDRQGTIAKNGAAFRGQPRYSIVATVNSIMAVSSPIIPVVGGTDYFESTCIQASGGGLSLIAHNDTWFSIEAVGFA